MDNILSELKNLSEKELINLNRAVVEQLKRERAAKAKAMKMTLNEGDTVRWTGRKGNQHGTVVSIKRKFAHVDVGNGTWRVPMSMLTKV
tara:strand:- start:2603 stop:2869 length:267 start_codon:yes stop_codon:yes gene_type:complete